MKKNNSKVFLVGFIVIALGAFSACIAIFFKSDFLIVQNDSSLVENNINNEITETQVVTEPAETSESPFQTESPDNISPMIQISSEIGVELSDIDDSSRILNRTDGNNKEFNVDLFATRHETINAFIFDISSEDNSSYLGDFKSGFGISVSPGCKNENVVSNNWCKLPDRVFNDSGIRTMITWDIPDDVKKYIDDYGHFMIGHWWSDVMSVRINSIVCLKTFSTNIKSDGTNIKDYSSVIDSNGDFSFAVSDILTEETQKLSAVTFHVSGENPHGLIKFEIIAKDRNGYEYPLKNLVQNSDSDQTDIVWIIPDSVSEKIDDHSIITFRYCSGDNENVTVENVTSNYYYY